MASLLSSDGRFEIHPKHHPEHKLRLKTTDHAKFKCDGCKEHGMGGKRYTCLQTACVFNLHEDCNRTEGTILVHPLLPKPEKYTFVFRFESSGSAQRLCDACGIPVLGFHYHCTSQGLDLHPCCAKLPLSFREGGHTFELVKETSHYRRCNHCKGRGGYMTFWFYRSTCKTVYLHVRCVKEVYCLPSSSTESEVDDNRVVGFVDETALHHPGSDKARTQKMFEAGVRMIVALISGGPVMPVIVEAIPGLLFNSTG